MPALHAILSKHSRTLAHIHLDPLHTTPHPLRGTHSYTDNTLTLKYATLSLAQRQHN